jgi:hypothetical protein
MHETKLIKYKDQQAQIDVEIANLVLNLWKLGLRTSNSCQDNVPKGFVWCRRSNQNQPVMVESKPATFLSK